MTHRSILYLTGLLWLLMGAWLLVKGLKFIGYTFSIYPCIGFLAGYLKGKFVLSKSALRIAARIYSLPLPLSFWKIYPPAYWLLIGSMMALGMLFNILPISADLHGAIDIAIGAALLRGAFAYLWYREPLSISKER